MKWLDAEPMKWWDAERISVSSFIIYTVQYTTVLPLLRVRNFLERSEQFAHCFQAVSGYSQDSLGYCLNGSRPQTGQFQTISWTVPDYILVSSRLYPGQFQTISRAVPGYLQYNFQFSQDRSRLYIQPGHFQAILPGQFQAIARIVPGYCQDSSKLFREQIQVNVVYRTVPIQV